VRRLRDVQTFPSREALVDQIGRDAIAARDRQQVARDVSYDSFTPDRDRHLAGPQHLGAGPHQPRSVRDTVTGRMKDTTIRRVPINLGLDLQAAFTWRSRWTSRRARCPVRRR
jgi:hypothetical protein